MIEIMTHTENSESVSDVNAMSLVNYSFVFFFLRFLGSQDQDGQSTTTLPAAWLLLNTFLRNVNLAFEPEVVNVHFFFFLASEIDEIKKQNMAAISF